MGANYSTLPTHPSVPIQLIKISTHTTYMFMKYCIRSHPPNHLHPELPPRVSSLSTCGMFQLHSNVPSNASCTQITAGTCSSCNYSTTTTTFLHRAMTLSRREVSSILTIRNNMLQYLQPNYYCIQNYVLINPFANHQFLSTKLL